jgi:hypothetical protein
MQLADRLRQEQQNSKESIPSEPSNAEVIAAVNAQTMAVNGLKAYLQIVIEETVKDELQKALPQTSQPFAGTSPQIASIGYRLSEIEKTLIDFSRSLDGTTFSAALKSLILETQRNRQGVVSAIERLQLQAEENRVFISNATVALQRMEKRATQQIEKALGQIAGEASQIVTASLAAANERAELIMAGTARLADRQLWSAAAAMFLTLLPVATVVAGFWMVVAGLFAGVQWATDVDGSAWLGIGRWLAVVCGLSAAAYGLFAGVRWTTSLIATWKGVGLPQWPQWRQEKR